MATYNELLQDFLDWSNRDIEVFGGGELTENRLIQTVSYTHLTLPTTPYV